MTRFRSGFGRLSANMLNRMVRAEGEVARHPTPPEPFRSRFYGPILCKVTAHAQHAGASINRWRYTVEEVNMSDTNNPIDLDSVSNGFSHDQVLNVAEWGNDADTSSGVDKDNLPGSYALQPIENGRIVPVYVSQTETDPYVFAWFNSPGEFDGVCSALAPGGATRTILDTYTQSGSLGWASAITAWRRMGTGTWSSSSTTTGTYLKLDLGSRIYTDRIVFSADDPGGWPTGARVRFKFATATQGYIECVEGTPLSGGDSVWNFVDENDDPVTYTSAQIEAGGTFGWDTTDTLTIEIYTL